VPLLVDIYANSGYILARMRYDIVLSPEAADDLRNLKAHLRVAVRDAIERHLRHAPAKVRVFYDVMGNTVEVLVIIPKSEADAWLKGIGG
jgi:mRNA interferase RelE/StbE